MITEAEVRAARVPLIVGFGGGVNSMAVLVGLAERGIRPDLVSFADTGGEKPGTYAYLDVVRRFLRAARFPELTVVVKASPRTGDATLEAECLRRETLPSRAFGLSSCAHRWKIEPQEKLHNHWPPALAAWARGDRPIKALGFDGGEQRRATVHEDRKLRYWYPLIEWDWDRDACEATIRRAGYPVPPKSACFFCPSSTKSEITQLRRENPALYRRAVAMEDVALASDRHELRSVRGLGRYFAWGALPGMSAEELHALPEAPVESCTICADEGEAA
jgi:hypothetical protein